MRSKTALAILLTLLPLTASAADGLDLEVGRAAPELRLPATDGVMHSLADADGTTVLIFYRGLW